ncbi:MAG: hypothetical protein MRY74_09300 [Neomegalonema sp.]|nr:hypothetical protein [Neomegalonema sp.]
MGDLAAWAAQLLATEGVDIGLGLLVTALGFYYNQMIVSPKSRERLATALEQKTPLARYRAFLSNALDWLDRQLARNPKTDPPEVRQRPFSTRLFEVSLTLSLLYPAILMLVLWSVYVSSARIGGEFVLLEDKAPALERVMALLALVITLLLALLARSKRRTPGNEWGEFIWLSIAVLVVTAGTFAVVEANQSAVAKASGQRQLLSTAVITSIAAAVTIAAAGAFRGATALLVALLVAGAAVLLWDVYECRPTAGPWGDFGKVICETPTSDADRISRVIDGVAARFGLAPEIFVKLGYIPYAAIFGLLFVLGLYACVKKSERREGRPRSWAKGAILRAFAFLLGSSIGALAGVVAFGGVISIGTAFGYGFALFCVVLIAQMASGAVRALSDWINWPPISFVLFGGYLAAVAIGFAWLASLEAVDPNLRMFFTMFAFLPMLNVVFDFLTTGATRFALRRGLANKGGSSPFLWTMFDILVATALFALLGIALVAAAHYVRLAEQPATEAAALSVAAETKLIDTAKVLTDIEQDLSAYRWLLISMLSTLAPTVAHLAIAIFSIVLFCWGGVSGWVARLVRAGGEDGASRAIASIALTAFTIASVVIPIIIIAAMIIYIGPRTGAIGDAYIAMLKSFAAILP